MTEVVPGSAYWTCPECGKLATGISREVVDVPWNEATQQMHVEYQWTGYQTYEPCGHRVQVSVPRRI